MSKETARNLFIVPSMPRLYQALLTGVGSYEALGNRIVKQIKAAHAFRRVEQVRELATILCNIPIKEYQLIGQYYLVWCNCRESVYKAEALENLISQTRTYKTQVLSSRAGIEVYQGNLEAALYFYNEALKTSPTVPDYIYMKLGVAQVKGFEGFHQSALNDIENLIPIIRYTEPKPFFETLNSYATELGMVGRFYEARNIMRHVLASPFISAYPEWRETAQELKPANRSFVTISSFPYNVLAMPEREHGEQVLLQPMPARVLDLIKWKKQMTEKEPNDKPKKRGKKAVNQDNPEPIPLDEMTSNDMTFRLLELITENFNNEDYLRKVVKAAERLIKTHFRDKPA